MIPKLLHELPFSAHIVIVKLAKRIASQQKNLTSTRIEDIKHCDDNIAAFLSCCDDDLLENYRRQIVKKYPHLVTDEACRLITLHKMQRSLENLKKLNTHI